VSSSTADDYASSSAGVIATMLASFGGRGDLPRHRPFVLDLIDCRRSSRPLFEPMGEYFAKQIDDHIEYPAMT